MKVMLSIVNVRIEFNFNVFWVILKTVEDVCKRREKNMSQLGERAIKENDIIITISIFLFNIDFVNVQVIMKN